MGTAFVIVLVRILVLAGILVAGMFGVIWAARHTNDRAGTGYSSIQPGMNAHQVHEALSGYSAGFRRSHPARFRRNASRLDRARLPQYVPLGDRLVT